MGGTRGKRVPGKKKPKSIKAKMTSKMSSKRKLSRMGKEMKKGYAGEAAQYLTRSQVLRKLQITLKDFRRLCILKGIYPRDPKKKPSGKDKAYYHIKNVGYLAHEPLLNKFRDIKAFMKKVRKALSRGDLGLARARQATVPHYTLDHLVRERYPRFSDALGDLDDALCLVHLFAALPADGPVKADRTDKCRRLALEWQYYVARSHALSKVFVSIKGVYFQAEVQGMPITWVIPHQFTQLAPPDVDFRIMLTFLEFYETLLRFVLFKLYHQLDLVYPPALDGRLDECGVYMAAVRGQALTAGAPGRTQEEDGKGDGGEEKKKKEQKPRNTKGLDAKLALLTHGDAEGQGEDDDEEELPEGAIAEGLGRALEDAMEGPDEDVYKREREERAKATLFRSLKFFLSREVPMSWMHFVISSFGGLAGWDGEGSPCTETDKAITHQVVDRPALRGESLAGREYIQPQWVLDSINAKMLLPVDLYGVGKPLPPHLSPFVDDAKEGYIPAYREELDKLMGKTVIKPQEQQEEEPEEQEAEAGGDEEEEEEDEEGEGGSAKPLEHKSADVRKQKKLDKKAEEKELAKIMLPKKHQRAYRIAQQGVDKQRGNAEALMSKRQRIEQKQQPQPKHGGKGGGQDGGVQKKQKK